MSKYRSISRGVASIHVNWRSAEGSLIDVVDRYVALKFWINCRRSLCRHCVRQGHRNDERAAHEKLAIRESSTSNFHITDTTKMPFPATSNSVEATASYGILSSQLDNMRDRYNTATQGLADEKAQVVALQQQHLVSGQAFIVLRRLT